MSAFEPTTKINFMKMRYFWFALSFVLMLASIYIWTSAGLKKYSIDFLGGTDLIVQFNQQTKPSDIRAALKKVGLDNAIVQGFETESNEFSIRVKGSETGNTTNKVTEALKTMEGGYTVLKNDFVGPVIGEKIKEDGFKAVSISIIGLLIYIAWRFEFIYALGAVLAVFHDVLISASMFIFLGGEIGAGALAALLTILGYSVNDTIITYDRIRENLNLKKRAGAEAKIGSLSLKSMTLLEIINLSINQTLSRTLLTAGTTIFSCLALTLLGGGAIAELSMVLTIGVAIGTYSSIFVAAPFILSLHRDRARK